MADFFTPDLGREVFGIAFQVFGGWLAWTVAEGLAAGPHLDFAGVPKHSPRERTLTYGRVVLVCLVLSFMLWANYGTHTESDGDGGEPLFGTRGGETVTDFEPTAAQRTRYALPFFLVLLPIALHGTWHGRRSPRQ